MRTNSKQVLQTAIIALVFFIAGKILFFRLFALFEPTITDIHFKITERPATIPSSRLFAMMMALVILLIAFVWRFGPVFSSARRAFVVLTIVTCMIVGILFRHQLVKNYFNGVVRPFLQAKDQLPFNYPIDPVNFVYYMFVGCCIGGVVSFFLFRQKKHSNHTKYKSSH